MIEDLTAVASPNWMPQHNRHKFTSHTDNDNQYQSFTLNATNLAFVSAEIYKTLLDISVNTILQGVDFNLKSTKGIPASNYYVYMVPRRPEKEFSFITAN
jgi:hypothetical protein